MGGQRPGHPNLFAVRVKRRSLAQSPSDSHSVMCCTAAHTYKGEGKAVPLQAWTGPEGSRKVRFPDFVTTAQDGGKVVILTHRPPLPPGNVLVLISVRG